MKFPAIAISTLFLNAASQAALYSQNFDSMAMSSTASVPDGWQFDFGTETSYSSPTSYTNVTQFGSANGGATFLFQDSSAPATDLSIGFGASNSYTGRRAIMYRYTNDTGADVSSFTASWDYELYRTGARATRMEFSWSLDGANWIAEGLGNTDFATTASTQLLDPPTGVGRTVDIATAIANGESLYFRWTYAYTGSASTGSNTMAIGIDNFTLVPAPGAAALLGSAILVAGRRRRN